MDHGVDCSEGDWNVGLENLEGLVLKPKPFQAFFLNQFSQSFKALHLYNPFFKLHLLSTKLAAHSFSLCSKKLTATYYPNTSPAFFIA